MPLAPGTALQNGHYVIDALLEAAPNGDLYWGTHVVAGMPVFIQVFPIADGSDFSDLSALIARLEGVAFAPQSPLPKSFQLFRGEAQTLCLAMGTAVGLPWSSARKDCSPLSPKQSLTNIRTIAHQLTWLEAQGITDLDLSSNRVWLNPGHDQLTLTGLPQAYLQGQAASETTPQSSVQGLSKLLFSFLTGQEISPNATDSSIKASLAKHRPTLSPLIVDAIVQGGRSPATPETTNLTRWLDMLPDSGTAYQVQSPRQKLIKSGPMLDRAGQARRSRLVPALGGTALIAAIVGVGVGTAWRLSATSLPGVIQLNPKQSFPAQAEWSGDSPEAAAFDEPFLPESDIPIQREEWFESNPPSEETQPEAAFETIETQDELFPDVEPSVTEPVQAPSAAGAEEQAPGVSLDDIIAPPEPAAEPLPSPVDPLEAPPIEVDPNSFSSTDDILSRPTSEVSPPDASAAGMSSEG
ncbi:MAG: hypothetical protein ACFBSG_10750 [Leptolyngbyaceae cyanobacterium]